MRLFGIADTRPPTAVAGSISSSSYKKLCYALRDLSKDELWSVLDHYIFHCMSDKDVDALVLGLDDLKKTGVPLTAETAIDLLSEDKGVSYLVKALPTEVELEASRNVLDLLFDETYFESYTPPALRAPTARLLITFAKDRGLPIMLHWENYLEVPENIQ